MIVEYKYAGQSGIVNGLDSAQLAFATNTLREPTFLQADLRFPLQLREGLAALYDVVVSDLKYRPRDRLEFFAWLEEQDRKFLASLGVSSEAMRQRLEGLESQLHELNMARRERRRPFYKARREFFEHIYTDEYELDYLLDPVITIHPDEISFEAFSRDESSYARLGASFEMFSGIESFECGTTNIDFSSRLHTELERMRSYRQTRFEVTPSGFAVAEEKGTLHKEKKIELPESWLMGFLQVHSVMSMGLSHFSMAPVDLYNLCRFLRRNKAKSSPRALRFELEPGKRVRAVLEPWEKVIELSDASVYTGLKPASIRTWGRDRLQVLARMIPVCEKIDVYLAGFGLPSVYVLDMGVMSFTLGLSGWTDNDWTGQKKFDLLTRRTDVNAAELSQVYQALREPRFATDSALAMATGLSVETCRSAASYLCQVGRAMYDLRGKVYRHRDLLLEPFAAGAAIAMAKKAEEEGNPEAKAAKAIVSAGNARIIARRPVQTGFKLSGSAKGADGRRVRPLVHVDHEGHVIEASCTCAYHKKHKLTKGPCEHILALRLAHMERLAVEQSES